MEHESLFFSNCANFFAVPRHFRLCSLLVCAQRQLEILVGFTQNNLFRFDSLLMGDTLLRLALLEDIFCEGAEQTEPQLSLQGKTAHCLVFVLLGCLELLIIGVVSLVVVTLFCEMTRTPDPRPLVHRLAG